MNYLYISKIKTTIKRFFIAWHNIRIARRMRMQVEREFKERLGL